MTYSFFVINMGVTTEAFLITRSFWALPVALVVHGVGYLACLREPRIFDLWLTKVSRTPPRPQLEALGLQQLRAMTKDRGIDMDGPGAWGAKEAKAGDRLPYARHLDATTLRLRDGAVMRMIQVPGLPFETEDSRRARPSSRRPRDDAAHRCSTRASWSITTSSAGASR